MKSGKTTMLVAMAQQLLLDGPVAILSPAIDTRTPLARHGGAAPPDPVRDAVSKIADASQYDAATAGARAVLVDEAQFLPREFIDVFDAEERRLFVFGLDTDYTGRPFGIMPDLAALAEHITKLSGVCGRQGCTAPSTRSRRLSGGDALVVVGAANYSPRCQRCFRAGI